MSFRLQFTEDYLGTMSATVHNIGIISLPTLNIGNSDVTKFVFFMTIWKHIFTTICKTFKYQRLKIISSCYVNVHHLQMWKKYHTGSIIVNGNYFYFKFYSTWTVPTFMNASSEYRKVTA